MFGLNKCIFTVTVGVVLRRTLSVSVPVGKSEKGKGKGREKGKRVKYLGKNLQRFVASVL
jgi:hypothetical protein